MDSCMRHWGRLIGEVSSLLGGELPETREEFFRGRVFAATYEDGSGGKYVIVDTRKTMNGVTAEEYMKHSEYLLFEAEFFRLLDGGGHYC